MNELELKDKKEISPQSERTYSCKVYSPDVDIYETEHELVLLADMPGVLKSNVNIQIHDNILHIEGQIQPEKLKDLKPLYSEYIIGHYQRDFAIGKDIDQNKISATLEEGVLRVVLPKAEDAKARSITIQ